MARQHNEEFKREAIRIALTSGLSRRQVASDLRIGFSTLSKWIQKFPCKDMLPTTDLDLAKENDRLRKENRRLKEERDLLKKATVFFAEQYHLSFGSYGRPRMTQELKEMGLRVGHRRIGRLMRDNGFRVIRTQKHKTTTNSV